MELIVSIISFIFRVLFDLLLHYLASVVLPIITFGKLKTRPIEETGLFDWPPYIKKDGTIYLGYSFSIISGITLVMVVGLIIYSIFSFR